MSDKPSLCCCGSSRTVWAAFAAHDTSWPVRWGAVYLCPALRQQQQQPWRVEEDVYPQLNKKKKQNQKKKAYSCTLRCVRVLVCTQCLLCLCSSWGFVLLFVDSLSSCGLELLMLAALQHGVCVGGCMVCVHLWLLVVKALKCQAYLE